jgi:long-chain acyl-CoA synthetase
VTSKKLATQSIAQVLADSARKHADRLAVIGPGLALTHAQLAACAGRAAAALQKQGVKAGGIVGVSLPTSALHLVTLLALARIGAGSVHLRTDLPQAVRDRIAKQFDVASVIGEKADPDWLEVGKNAGKPQKSEPKAKPGSPWRIALSSGTTGLQKAVLANHAACLAYFKLHAKGLPIDGEDRFLCHRGLDANLALNPALRSLIAGGSVVFPDSLRIEHFIEAVERHKVTQAVVSPAYLRDLVERLPPGTHRLPSLRRLLIAGSVLAPALAEEAMQRVTPNLYDLYGAMELGMVALADPDILRRAPLSVGRIAPGMEAQAVDEEDAPLPAGTTGILRFRRAGMPTEYYRNPEATARSFRRGWFYPGDTGRVEADGLLYVEGRVDDRLNFEGVKVEPAMVERALQSHPAVVEAAAFAAAPDENRPLLFAAAVLRSPVDEKALIAHCRQQVGPMYTPARIFFDKALPRNEAGKIVRSKLAERVKRKPAA